MVKSLDFDQGLKVSVPRNLATTWPALQTQSNLSNFCKAEMISILQPDWQIDRPIMASTQILVHRWGPRTRISALFCR